MTNIRVTTATLRAELLQDLADLREGRINNATARARSAVASTVIKTIGAEVAVAQLGKAIEPVDLSCTQPSLRSVG